MQEMSNELYFDFFCYCSIAEEEKEEEKVSCAI